MLKYRSVNFIFLALLTILVGLNLFLKIPLICYAVLLMLYMTIQVYGSKVVSSQFFIPTRCTGDQNSNSIAITFDDGPLPVMTQRVLEILKVHKATAAFFCIGQRVAKNPEIVKQISAEGHIIGNHSFFHGKLFDLQSSKKMKDELEQTDRVIEKATGEKPRFFRPPYGVTNPNLSRAVKKCGHVVVGWNVRSLDTITKNETELYNRVTKNLKGGDIVLFHDYCESTINILPKVLDHIAKAGLKVVRLDVLLNEKAYV